MSSPERKDHLIISQRELYYGVAALVCAGLFIFMSGYFLGKKRVLAELAAQYDDESFADKVYQSFSAFADANSEENAEAEQNSVGEIAAPEQSVVDSSEVNHTKNQKLETKNRDASLFEKANLAYAQLCGFGTKNAAEFYVDRVKRRGISVTIVERKSQSKRGRIVTWYQVVTGSMNRKNLEELVQKMKKDDKLSSVQIIDVGEEQAPQVGLASTSLVSEQ